MGLQLVVGTAQGPADAPVLAPKAHLFTTSLGQRPRFYGTQKR